MWGSSMKENTQACFRSLPHHKFGTNLAYYLLVTKDLAAAHLFTCFSLDSSECHSLPDFAAALVPVLPRWGCKANWP